MAVVNFKQKPGNTSELAYKYLRRGIALIQLMPGTKKPRGSNWQEDVFTNPEDATYFTKYNIGFSLGTKSKGLTDIDLDCDESIKLARSLLPDTHWIFGRRSRRCSHYLYHVKSSKTRKFFDPSRPKGESMLLEIRSDGAQTMAPGSTHPEGELVSWEGGNSWESSEPSKLRLEDLNRASSELAAACLVLRYGWVSGKRDEVAVALCGLLLRAGWENEEVDYWLEAIAIAAGDEELDMRLKAAYQEKRLADDQRVPGIPRLKELLGDNICSAVIEWLGIKSIGVVEKLNEQIAFVTYGGRARILFEDNQGFEFLPVKDAADRLATLPTVKNGKKEITSFQTWMTDSHRRSYNRVVFDPDPDYHPEVGEYNLWRGWPIEAKKGSCKLFLNHVMENLARGDKDLYDYIISWLADAVQNPTVRPGVAIVLQSPEEGTGKSSFMEYVLAMYGKYGMIETSMKNLFGDHNQQLMNKLMVFADDATWAGDRAHRGILNNLVTSSRLSINPKGVNQFEVESFMRLVFATNHEWAMSVSATNRRFVLIQAKAVKSESERVLRRARVIKMLEERDQGGAEALLHYLMHYPIKRDLRVIPSTELLLENRVKTMEQEDPLRAWLFARLVSGEMPSGVPWENREGRVVKIKRGVLRNDYLRFLRTNMPHIIHGRNAATSRSMETAFGRAIRTIVPGTVGPGRVKLAGRQEYVYIMSPLSEFRAAFNAEFLNNEYVWE